MISATTVLTTLSDGMIALRDLASGRERCTLPTSNPARRGRLRPAAISPDGRLLATVGAGIDLWDAIRGEHLRALEWTCGFYWRVSSSAFSADGLRFAAGLSPDPELYTECECVETTLVWDTAGGQQVLALHGNAGDVNPPFVDAVAFSPDGLVLAAAGVNGSISLFDVATGERIRRLAVGWTNAYALVFSPDGRVLASNGGLLDLAGHAKPHKLKGHAGEIDAIAFAPSGAFVATGSRDGLVKLWDRWSGRVLPVVLTHGAPVIGLAFPSDDSTLATQSNDGTVKMWHVASGQALAWPPT